MAAVTFRQRDKINIDADETEEAFWTGRQVSITVQAELETQELIPETEGGWVSPNNLYGEAKAPLFPFRSKRSHPGRMRPSKRERDGKTGNKNRLRTKGGGK